jgi:putative transposase
MTCGARGTLGQSLQYVGRKVSDVRQGMNGPQFDREPALCNTDLMLRTFKYRLYPTKEQRRLLDQHLAECRWLYNRLLEERKTAWEQRQETLRLYNQQATLPALKAARPSLDQVQSQVLQNVAVRLDLAFKAFFRRIQAGQKPGYPRFRREGRYDSFTFPQVPVGCHLNAEAKRLRIMNVGLVKVVVHRSLEGMPKTATIHRSRTGKWYVSFSCECAEPVPLPLTGREVGLDVGLKTFATLSTSVEDGIANPRFFRRDERALAGAQRRMSRAEQGTPEWLAGQRVIARIYERIARRRADFAYQHSRRIVDAFDLIAIEELSVSRMMHAHGLAKSIHDAAWGSCPIGRGAGSQRTSPTRQHGPVGAV